MVVGLFRVYFCGSPVTDDFYVVTRARVCVCACVRFRSTQPDDRKETKMSGTKKGCNEGGKMRENEGL